jgi:DNA-directed RNA polymerase specialized sigma24 family protein
MRLFDLMCRVRDAEIRRDSAVERADREAARAAQAEYEDCLGELLALLVARLQRHDRLQMADAQDVAQEVVTTLLRQRIRIRSPAGYTALVKRIYRSRRLDFGRAETRRRKKKEKVETAHAAGVLDPPDGATGSDRQATLAAREASIAAVLCRAHALVKAQCRLEDADDKGWAFLHSRVQRRPIASLLALAPAGSRYDRLRPPDGGGAAMKTFQDQVSRDTERYREALGKVLCAPACPLAAEDRVLLADIIANTQRRTRTVVSDSTAKGRPKPNTD